MRTRATGASARSHRLRRGLMVVEVALALILLAGAGLMVRTMQRLTAVDAGFRPDHVLTMRFMPAGPQWRDDARRAAFLDQVIDAVRPVPSVTAVALADSLPIDGSNWNSVFLVRDKPVPPRALLPSAAFTPVSASYLETMGMRLLSGRFFDATDTAASPKTIVINEALAKRLWPGEDADRQAAQAGLAGVADAVAAGRRRRERREVRRRRRSDADAGVSADGPGAVRRPGAGRADPGPPAAARAGIEAAVHRLDADLPLYGVQTMDGHARARRSRGSGCR